MLKQYPVRHIVLDTNSLSAGLVPHSVHSQRLRQRAAQLVRCRLLAGWESLRLYAPGICVAEILTLLDKYRFCTWFGPVKKDPRRRLNARAYRTVRSAFLRCLHDRRIEQIDLDHKQIELVELISPLNQRYQFRRRRATKNIPGPMSTGDCLVAAGAMQLNQRLGDDSVVVVTDDRRLADVLTIARGLSLLQVGRVGLREGLTRLGLTLDSLFPRVVHLRTATKRELRAAFLGWPLPQQELGLLLPNEQAPEDTVRFLIKLWLDVEAEYEVSIDNLPYTRAIDDLRTRVATQTNLELTSQELYHLLLTWRKARRIREVRSLGKRVLRGLSPPFFPPPLIPVSGLRGFLLREAKTPRGQRVRRRDELGC